MKCLCDAYQKFPSLKYLRLKYNNLSANKKNNEHFSPLTNFKSLTLIVLGGNNLNDDDLEELFLFNQEDQKSQEFKQKIEYLFLGGNKVAEKTLKGITNSKLKWKSLDQLSLGKNINKNNISFLVQN